MGDLNDLLSDISDAESSCALCSHPLDATSPSGEFCSEKCQRAWARSVNRNGRYVTAPTVSVLPVAIDDSGATSWGSIDQDISGAIRELVEMLVAMERAGIYDSDGDSGAGYNISPDWQPVGEEEGTETMEGREEVS